jgi:hypothetical protein
MLQTFKNKVALFIVIASMSFALPAFSHSGSNHNNKKFSPASVYWSNSQYNKAQHGRVYPKGYSGRFPYPSYYYEYGKNKYLKSNYKYRYNYHYYDQHSWVTYSRSQDYKKYYRFQPTSINERQTI